MPVLGSRARTEAAREAGPIDEELYSRQLYVLGRDAQVTLEVATAAFSCRCSAVVYYRVFTIVHSRMLNCWAEG